MLNLSTARVTTSNNSLYCGDWGANPQRSPHHPPRRKIGEVQSPLPGGQRPQNKLPESRQRIWQVRKKIGTFPFSIPPARSSCEPNPTSGAAVPVRNAGESSLLKESFLGAKHTQWHSLTMQTSRADSACFAPKQTTHKLCVSPLVI